MRARNNPGLVNAGILLTRFNPRGQINNVIRETAADMAKTFNIPLLRTTIRTGVDLTKAQILRRDHDPLCPQKQSCAGLSAAA